MGMSKSSKEAIAALVIILVTCLLMAIMGKTII